ncbi:MULTISPECIES: hypothetical protein [Streptomycetaceae]|uniref:Uncharacterized protein n=1 Tax=Streptantibioticus cattleyicolor (strain ATCC 35852 / DSM 46488 / JCM 4925 / NBRC 14057 / NRRL 8057) TaxID=1003195 RepID=F8JQH0_STREN|nr:MULTISPECIES: hypothetical protein [Streptomycetaceae]AEW97813.1 hypothetical protein SCATT_54420 [Streptantibioticus cattleyicolor NRRL 8057 = DSM 46488]MYS62229.1 transcriptional regulator [Streptomyces sp. SID5468]CCB78131.1 conserved protein of unknown function [Streptantibioticus cattleyicolor NRRL 8057 = DSM 46488]
MTRTPQDVLAAAVRGLAPDEDANRLVPEFAAGRAPLAALTAFALEQRHIITGDRHAFRHLARERTGEPAARAFFAALAEGEDLALDHLAALSGTLGLDRAVADDYEPLAGCQAYPAYTAWLALNAEPVDVVVALSANFAAWGGCCAAMGRALRAHYGLPDGACAFFDFFARPDPRLRERSLAAVGEGLAAGRLTGAARRYGRLLQEYELMFWNTLADRTL